jgi:hypothetical protein
LFTNKKTVHLYYKGWTKKRGKIGFGYERKCMVFYSWCVHKKYSTLGRHLSVSFTVNFGWTHNPNIELSYLTKGIRNIWPHRNLICKCTSWEATKISFNKWVNNHICGEQVEEIALDLLI